MKFLAQFAGVMLLISPVVVHADEASKQAKIEQMLEVSHSDRMVVQVIDQMHTLIVNQTKQMKLPPEAQGERDELQQRLFALLGQSLKWDTMKPVYIKIYDETFSEQEISGILEFYKSPAGQAMLNKMPVLIQKSISATQGLVAGMMPEITRITEEVEKKYQKQ